MLKIKRTDEPRFMIAHEMISKLSDIIGNCDLMSEMLESNSEASRRLTSIRNTARTCVADLREHERKAG